MHVQTTGARSQQAIISGARPEPDERQSVDIVLASDAHGAFAWGVLDRLLDESGFAFNTITASGFAAVEAAVLVYGLGLGGRRGARIALTNFWRRVSHASMLTADRTDLLRSILNQSIDIEQIRNGRCTVKLSILAANARTDALKIFTGDQLTINAIVAAATVPFLFPA
ncbi:patatin-like phospholipase family protein, partial [Mesorhizobium sp. USDA-HM6]